MKESGIKFSFFALHFTLCLALCAAAPSPLATQDWTRCTFYDAIQATGRTNVLAAADRQMISNYIDEVARLYAGRAETMDMVQNDPLLKPQGGDAGKVVIHG